MNLHKHTQTIYSSTKKMSSNAREEDEVHDQAKDTSSTRRGGGTLVIKVVTQCVFSLPLHTSKEMMCGVDSTIFFKLKGKYDFILSNIERMFNLRLKLL